MYRSTITALIRAPYWTGAFTPAGPSAVVVTPHRHRRETSSCSVTRMLIGGRSNTWRRATPTSGARPRPCLLYTSDAADEEDSVDLGGRRIIKKKKREKETIRRKPQK